MSASRRFPRSRFQPGIAAIYACTGASPSAFAVCGLPPERSLHAAWPSSPAGLALLRRRAILATAAFTSRLNAARVDLLPFVESIAPSRVAFRAGIEEARWVGSWRRGEGELHHLRSSTSPVNTIPLWDQTGTPAIAFDGSSTSLLDDLESTFQDQRPPCGPGLLAPIPQVADRPRRWIGSG